MDHTALSHIARSLAQNAADFIVSESTKNSLGLSTSCFFWPETQTWNPCISDFDDLGDYLTFVAWFGVVFDIPLYRDFVKEQIKIWDRHFLLPSGFHYSQYDHSKPLPKQHDFRTVSIYDHHDALLGFHELFAITGDVFYRQHWEDLSGALLPYVKHYHGFIPNRIFPSFKVAVPYASSIPTVCGLVAEEFCYLSRLPSHANFFESAHSIFHAWIHTPLFRTHALFHEGYNSFFPTFSPYRSTQLMKANTNMVFSMIAFLTMKKDSSVEQALLRFFDRLENFRSSDGSYYSTFDLDSSSIRKDAVNKTQNFAVLSILLDAYILFQDKRFLERALQIAEFWISKTYKKTGLIPEAFSGSHVINVAAKIDQSSDLSVEFLKLYQLTGEDIYLERATDWLLALQSYFITPQGFWRRLVHAETGLSPFDRDVPSSEVPVGRNLTKYVGGSLKFLVFFSQVLSGASFLKDHSLSLMIRDR